MTVTESGASFTKNHSSACTLHDLTVDLVGEESAVLFITINFADGDWEPPLPGKVFFGFRKGELRFEFEEGSMPFRYREFIKELDLSLRMEHEVVTRREIGSSLGATLSGEFGQETSLTPSKKGSTHGALTKTASRGSEDSSTKRYVDIFGQISTKGDDNKPAWVFLKKPNDEILSGALDYKKLGQVKLGGGKCKATVGFHVNKSDIVITAVEGIIPEKLKLKDNTKGIIRAVLLKELRKKFPEKISEATIVYGYDR